MMASSAEAERSDSGSGGVRVIDLDRLQLGLTGPIDLGLGDVRIWPLPNFQDMRGKIVPLELTRDLPFPAKRHFVVYGIPEQVRGEHAHRKCHQLIVALNGRFNLALYDGETRIELVLGRPSLGIYVPPMIWVMLHRFSPESIVSVYCSDPYDPIDYIRNLEEFEREASDRKFHRNL